MNRFGDRLVELALSLLAAAVLVSVAWSILRPLVMVIAVGAVALWFVSRLLLRRRL